MGQVIVKGERVILRKTTEIDLEYILIVEREHDEYVGQWSREEHIKAQENPDLLHLLIEEKDSKKNLGYVIIAGIQDPNRSIELRRLVITEKKKGNGKETLVLIKKYFFEELKRHRLWLDVRLHNSRAQNLYLSQGFVQEGILRDCILKNGKFESLILMSILESEYFNT